MRRNLGIGIIGVDGGKTTGLAWGRFSPDLRDRTTLWNALARGRGVDWDQIGPDATGGDSIAAGLLVTTKIGAIMAEWNLLGLGVDDMRIIIEDFQLRRDLIGGTGRDKLAPVFVAGLVVGAWSGVGFGRCIRFVAPSQSKSKANDDRMKYWARLARPRGTAGWVKGKPHARDAFRLVATGLDQLP
jgi:hypothetical protein